MKYFNRKKQLMVLNLLILVCGYTLSGCDGSGSSSKSLISSTGTSPNSINLTWVAPTTNSDGSTLTDLAGFLVKYGTTSGHYTSSLDVGNVTSSALSVPAGTTYYIAVVAYDTYGNQSIPSNEVSN